MQEERRSPVHPGPFAIAHDVPIAECRLASLAVEAVPIRVLVSTADDGQVTDDEHHQPPADIQRERGEREQRGNGREAEGELQERPHRHELNAPTAA
jgi:hypothetical protein